jgi:DNA-binding Lrp family transcriptional regulator
MFDWRESPTFRKYSKAIDKTCQKIIKALHETGTNNLSLLAKKTGMSPALVHYYYDKLTSKNILKLKVKVNVVNMGLQPIEIIFKDEGMGKEPGLESYLKGIEYWRNIEKYYVQMDTYWHVYFNIPKEAINDFNRYVRNVSEKAGVRIVYMNTNPIDINPKPNVDWFNEEERRWEFKWSEWMDEVVLGSREVDFTVPKMGEFVVLDKPDVFIIQKLEEDAETSFKEMANEMGVTPPTVRYHYYKHLVKYDIIEGYEAILKLFPENISINILGHIQFTSRKNMNSFIASLEGKPFSSRVLANLEDNRATVYFYIPFDQIVELNKALINMKRAGIIKDCTMGLIDYKSKMEKSLPMNLYEKGSWKMFF